MKLNIALLVAVAILSACSRPVIRETIVERPVPAAPVVTSPVVTSPVVTAAAPLPACTYASQSYSHGSVSCQDRNLYRCDSGVWTRTVTPC